MKFRHVLTGLVFTMGILAATALTSLAAIPTGRFEAVNSTAVCGWAYNSSAPNDALTVRISITNKETGEEVFSQQVSAGEYRQSLYNKNKGNGCHGFTLSMDWTAYPAGSYLVEGFVGDEEFINPMTYSNGSASAQSAQDSQGTQNADGAQSDKSQESGTGLVPLGVFKTTGYCPCKGCSEGWGRHTCTGAIAKAGHTIAVDPRIIPYGSKVMINGVVYTAEDRGGAVRGNHIDIFFDTHAETRMHGTQNAEVYLVMS